MRRYTKAIENPFKKSLVKTRFGSVENIKKKRKSKRDKREEEEKLERRKNIFISECEMTWKDGKSEEDLENHEIQIFLSFFGGFYRACKDSILSENLKPADVGKSVAEQGKSSIMSC